MGEGRQLERLGVGAVGGNMVNTALYVKDLFCRIDTARQHRQRRRENDGEKNLDFVGVFW